MVKTLTFKQIKYRNVR